MILTKENARSHRFDRASGFALRSPLGGAELTSRGGMRRGTLLCWRRHSNAETIIQNGAFVPPKRAEREVAEPRRGLVIAQPPRTLPPKAAGRQAIIQKPRFVSRSAAVRRRLIVGAFAADKAARERSEHHAERSGAWAQCEGRAGAQRAPAAPQRAPPWERSDHVRA